MFELVSIKQQKKNPNYYWVTLSWHGLSFHWGTYRHDEKRYLPPAMLMNKRWVTTVVVPLNRHSEIVAMCQQVIASKIFDKDEEEGEVANIQAVYYRDGTTEIVTDVATPKAPEAAKPKKVEKPGCETYGLEFDRVTDADYSKLSEFDQAVYQLKFLYACKKAYPNHYPEAAIENEFLNLFPDREDLYFAAQEALCAKK